MLGGLIAAALAAPAFGQDAAPAADAAAAVAEAAPAAPVPDPGNTAWMLISSALVLLMTIPGLALFYGGLVRAKNMLSVLMQVFAITCLVMILWVIYGYSLAFSDGGSLNSTSAASQNCSWPASDRPLSSRHSPSAWSSPSWPSSSSR